MAAKCPDDSGRSKIAANTAQVLERLEGTGSRSRRVGEAPGTATWEGGLGLLSTEALSPSRAAGGGGSEVPEGSRAQGGF